MMNGSMREDFADEHLPIPKGLCPPAQGCEARATLGFEPDSPALHPSRSP